MGDEIEELIEKAKNGDLSERIKATADLELIIIQKRLKNPLVDPRDPRVVPHMLDILRKKDEDWRVRMCAVNALAEHIGDCREFPAVLPTLKEVLKDNNANVRESVAHALAKFSLRRCARDYIRECGVVEAVREAMKENNASIRYWGLETLNRLGAKV